jgi:hypothetical protein
MDNPNSPALLFVYNADTGLFNLAADIAHKLFSPSTYSCSLCGLTYGVFSIRAEWKEFIEQTPIEMEFLHRDEFREQYPQFTSLALPAVLKKSDGDTELFLDAQTLNGLGSIAELKALLGAGS